MKTHRRRLPRLVPVLSAPVQTRRERVGLAVAVAALVGLLSAGPSAALAAKPGTGGSGSGTPAPAPSTFVKNYANLVNRVQYDLTPADIQTTADGGTIAVAHTQSAAGISVSWVIKRDAVGTPQWQEEVGCFALAPGEYSYGLSIQQADDGGYVVAGGTLGCGSGPVCPPGGGLQCGMVEKLDASGRVVWARAYAAGAHSTAIEQVRRTPDGGYLAVGSASDVVDHTGALLLKLDSAGGVQWQRRLSPAGSDQAYVNAVTPVAGGGYVGAGEFQGHSPTGLPRSSVLAVRLNADGTVVWQRAFDRYAAGTPEGAGIALAVTATSDGGVAIGGAASTGATGGRGALLLKLDSAGAVQRQWVYSGGQYCFFNGFGTTCTDLGGVAYSIQQTADGGYILGGDGRLKLVDSVPLVPWLAKADANGGLQWQRFYYQAHPSTGRPLSQYFAAATVTGTGYSALGFTENVSNGKGELLGVRTDGLGLVGSCAQVRPATPLAAVNPGLTSVPAGLTPSTPPTPSAASGAKVLATSVTYTTRQC